MVKECFQHILLYMPHLCKSRVFSQRATLGQRKKAGKSPGLCLFTHEKSSLPALFAPHTEDKSPQSGHMA